jgi:hypothetical protein
MKTKGVSGVGIAHNKKGEEILQIYVAKKEHGKGLPSSYKLDDDSTVEVEVIEVGEIVFTGFTGKYRPAQPGAVIGNPNAPYDGTFGAVVKDNLTGNDVILGASHVMANFNQAEIGDPIIQPSSKNGGTVATDTVGTLLRFVNLNLTHLGVNRSDAAIATPTVSIRDRSFCSPIKTTKQSAVGLVYAASSAITVINPAAFVEADLNVSFNKKKTATVGMSIHMCGAYSGYQQTNVQAVNVDIWVNYMGNQIMWDDQIIAPPVGTAGDSGSVFYTTF